jgi:choline dehydrogenase-like flavoprotein
MREFGSFGYVIVGGGSAGCVLANRLSASRAQRVLLLEAGGEDRNPWIHIPIGYGKLFKKSKANWLYESEPEPELNNRRVVQPRGKVLGGSSSINGLVYIRGQKEDSIIGASSATSAGALTTCCLISARPRISSAAMTSSTARAGRSPSAISASRTSSATPSSPRRRKPASRAMMISTDHIRKGRVISRRRLGATGAAAPPWVIFARRDGAPIYAS